MRYGLEVVTLGDYADPRPVVDLALAAEAAGWDGRFVWDHLGFAWGAVRRPLGVAGGGCGRAGR
jgi:alkanesulfonate monooxygenase SsuD/methylene tetrahydromethanopterin reductase-like flavin-dependent oxidoreductase (luciferase family)